MIRSVVCLATGLAINALLVFNGRLNAGLYVLGAASILAVVLHRYQRPVPSGHCRECGYDLTGNVSGVCPECGVEVQT